jgi:uncharacterized protein involved in cysteine biosynthesis
MSSTSFVASGWIETSLDYLFSAGAVVMAWFLFPILTPVIASFFVEKVVTKIEESNYKGSVARVSNNGSKTFFEAIKFTFIMLILNILCLPFYFIPVVNIAVYYLLNSYLISREFFDMASASYLEPKDAKTLRKANRFSFIGLGFVIILINNIPVINLLAPIIAITLMTHLFFMLNKK